VTGGARSRRGIVTVSVALALIGSTTLDAGAAQLPPGGSFTDDDGNTHEGTIEAIAAAEITLGCNPPFNDHYCPSNAVKRGEMAAFLRRALELPGTGTDYFTDDNGSTFEGDINAIAEAGITLGCNPPANTRYCPGDQVRRDQMAGFLRRARNLPAIGTDYFSDDNGSTFEDDINRLAAAGITLGCNPPVNNRYCPSDLVNRDQMASFLARALQLTPDVPPARPDPGWELVVDGLDSPVQVLAPPGDDRLLIAEQGGTVRSYESGSVTTFLDIREDVVAGGERGLLSIAVHPGYPADRRLFAWFSGSGGRTYLVEYDIAADLTSAFSPRTVLSVDQPASNHNGGFIDFGADGYLYLGLGDGGGSNDTYRRARDLTTLLGKMIRIDVDGAKPYEIPFDNPYVGVAGAHDEIWASGLRNPWRWSFDDGLIYIGDVGQGTREEIDAVPVSPVGYDFGWSRFEGTVCNPNDHDPSCSTSGLTFPVIEYGRSTGQTVTGGIVYRGPTVRSLSGYYLYADVYSGLVRAFRMDGGTAVDRLDLTPDLRMSGIVSFGENDDGELLVVNLFEGTIYRLTGG
jgi:glucose/arabinose dehydrogenase